MFSVGDKVIFNFKLGKHHMDGEILTIKTVKAAGDKQICTFEEWEIQCPSYHLKHQGFKGVFNNLNREG